MVNDHDVGVLDGLLLAAEDALKRAQCPHAGAPIVGTPLDEMRKALASALTFVDVARSWASRLNPPRKPPHEVTPAECPNCCKVCGHCGTACRC